MREKEREERGKREEEREGVRERPEQIDRRSIEQEGAKTKVFEEVETELIDHERDEPKESWIQE